MSLINLGNVTGLIKSLNPPTKTYVLWGQILNPTFPNIVRLHIYQGTAWVPLDSLTGSNYWLDPVLDELDTPPTGSVAAGSRYLVGSQPTGQFTNFPGQVATWNGQNYQFRVPAESAIVYVEGSKRLRLYGNGTWSNLGGGAFQSNFTVSLSGGKTFGKFTSGQQVPAKDLSAEEVILLAAIEAIYPSYGVASLGLIQSAPVVGELGESVNDALTATFYQGDAGALSAIRIEKDGQVLAAGNASPLNQADALIRTLATVDYQAYANYAAGPIKPVPPANTPDDRLPQVRNPNAPQAAETDLESNGVQIVGIYPWFYGSSATNGVPDVYGTGTKVIAASSGSLFVPAFGAGAKYLWFAVPRDQAGNSQKAFTSWYRTALDNGAIGGGTNLFASLVVVPVSSAGLGANWTHDYDLYFSNYQTDATTATTLN
jgi:hypothetical protein